MKNITLTGGPGRLIFIVLTGLSFVLATDWENSETGRLGYFKMINAPYPDTSRIAGYTRGEEFYPPENHYSDNSVAIFIPAGFQPGKAVDLLFYFHGHNNNLAKSFEKFSLREMVQASGKNVILVFPQGPRDARDSGCGKLEVADGFERLVAEVMDNLKDQAIIDTQPVGRILLSGHSGAYKVIGRILHHGGLTDKISEVYLLDASYGQLDVFNHWMTINEIRFCSIFTDHLASENVIMMKNLSRLRVKYLLLAEESVTDNDLKNSILFLHAEKLTHAETVRWLEKFLESSRLENI